MTPISTRPSIGGDTLQARRRGGGSPKLSYVDAVKIDHPEVLWPLDDAVGSPTTRDLSGHSNTGTVAVGHQTLAFGVPGYTSDGATAVRQASADPGDNPAAVSNALVSIGVGNHPLTLECAAARFMDYDGIVVCVGIGIGGGTVGLYIDDTYLYLTHLSGGIAWFTHGVNPNSSLFHHYAVTWNGVAAHGIVDGMDLGAPAGTSGTVPNIAGAGVFANGEGPARPGATGQFDLAVAAAYDHALTIAQIAAHVAAR